MTWNPITLEDVRRAARRRLPRAIFDIIDGGAGDEYSLRANRCGFEKVTFRPRPLVDVSSRDLSTEVFGERLSFPVMIAPTGAGRLVHRYAELEVAGAAGDAGTIYLQSTGTSYPLEEVAARARGPLWYQLYVPPARQELTSLVSRAQDSGYQALAVSIDTPVFGNRERDTRNRVTMPFRIRPRHLLEAVFKPRWTAEFLRGNIGIGVGRKGYMAPRLPLRATEAAVMAAAYPVTWPDIAEVRSRWQGPMLVKGIMRPDECQRLIDAGVDGIIVSNHGGRQLDGVPGTVEVLPAIVAAVQGRVPVLLDGGVRRGVDVVKALALGARAVFIGRPYLYGLAVAGESGVRRVLEILRKETDQTMALLGCRSTSDIDATLVGGSDGR